jgi:hypothetical protein
MQEQYSSARLPAHIGEQTLQQARTVDGRRRVLLARVAYASRHLLAAEDLVRLVDIAHARPDLRGASPTPALVTPPLSYAPPPAAQPPCSLPQVPEPVLPEAEAASTLPVPPIPPQQRHPQQQQQQQQQRP